MTMPTTTQVRARPPIRQLVEGLGALGVLARRTGRDPRRPGRHRRLAPPAPSPRQLPRSPGRCGPRSRARSGPTSSHRWRGWPGPTSPSVSSPPWWPTLALARGNRRARLGNHRATSALVSAVITAAVVLGQLRAAPPGRASAGGPVAAARTSAMTTTSAARGRHRASGERTTHSGDAHRGGR